MLQSPQAILEHHLGPHAADVKLPHNPFGAAAVELFSRNVVLPGKGLGLMAPIISNRASSWIKHVNSYE